MSAMKPASMTFWAATAEDVGTTAGAATSAAGAAVIVEPMATAVAAASARAGRVSASMSTPDAEDSLLKTWQETIRIL